MPPHTPEHQSIPVSPATLPAISASEPQAGMPASSDGQGAAMGTQQSTQDAPLRTVANVPTHVESTAAGAEAIHKAKQLVATYSQDPFQLATLFADLKADHLAHEHHIAPGGGDH